MWGQRSYHPIGPALRLYIFIPPFIRHLCSACTCVCMCTALDVRTQVMEYWVAIKCRDESRHVNYGIPDSLPMTCWKEPLDPRSLRIISLQGCRSFAFSKPWALSPQDNLLPLDPGTVEFENTRPWRAPGRLWRPSIPLGPESFIVWYP